jgi:hypothetical protein
MPDPVTRTTDLGPRLVRAQRRALITQPNRRFTDDQQLPFDRSHCLCIRTEFLEADVGSKILNTGDGIENVPK